jgi:large subunit ribosomal protein L6
MSRIGKKPIPLPDKTSVRIADGMVTVTGVKGSLSRPVPPGVDLVLDGGTLLVNPKDDKRQTQAFRGLARALLANMVMGVSQGFTRVLEVNGIGYRAELSGRTLSLMLGHSHPLNYVLPEGVTAEVDKKNNITLASIDKELLGQAAANIRSFRPPEPYKGKGVKYAEETIIRKAGKSGAK